MTHTIKDYFEFNYKDKKVKMPQILMSLISIAIRRVDLKLDNFWLISGKVGSGKSTLAKGIAGTYEFLMSRDLTLQNFTWRSDGVVDFTDNPENKTKVIIQDEGIQGMTGRDSVTKSGHKLKVTLVTKRRMNIFYIVLIDEIQEYSQKIINRATLLLDTRFVMDNGDPQRGQFKIYNQEEIKEAYSLIKDKKLKTIEHYKGNTKPFYKFWNYEDVFINEDEVEAKKIEETSQQDETLDKRDSALIKLMRHLRGEGKTNQNIADITGYSYQQVSRLVNTPT